jgi:phage terminase Nu1 subunit (DNA packaging protein)
MTTATKRSTDVLVTGAELARRLDVNPRTLRKWRTEPGFPVAVRGSGTAPSLYDEAEVKLWHDAREQRARHDAADLTRARTRRETAQARLGEQQHKLRAGKLIAVEEAERLLTIIVTAVRAKLLHWPTTLADKLHRVGATEGAAGIERVLQEAVYDTLTELSRGSITPKKRRPRKPSRARRLNAKE